jgi:hypothetical protein
VRAMMKMALPGRTTIRLKHCQEENVAFNDEEDSLLTDASKLKSIHKSRVYERLRHTHTPTVR